MLFGFGKKQTGRYESSSFVTMAEKKHGVVHIYFNFTCSTVVPRMDDRKAHAITTIPPSKPRKQDKYSIQNLYRFYINFSQRKGSHFVQTRQNKRTILFIFK